MLNLDPKGRYLIQDQGGKTSIHVWTEKFSKRKDMRSYDPVKDEVVNELKSPPAVPLSSIVIQDKTYEVESDLYDAIVDMANHIAVIKTENEKLKDELSARSAPPEIVKPEEKTTEPPKPKRKRKKTAE